MYPKHYNNRYKKQKRNFEKLLSQQVLKTTTAIRLNLLPVCLFVLPLFSICCIIYTIFKLLIKSGYFNACYTHTQYSGKINSHYLNVNKFRDKVPLRNTL